MLVKFHFREATDLKTFGGLRIWQKPFPTSQYVIGADVAEGVGKDASCAQVLDFKTGVHVASFWSDAIDVDTYAAELVKLGNFYNRAFICVESNNHGNGVIAHLGGSFSGLAYPNLYKRYEYDEFTRKQKRTIGFKTTTATKPKLIENLKAALRDGEVTTFDKFTIQEICGFIRDDKGKIGAKGKAHDDRVIALALANEQRLVLKSNTSTDHEYIPQMKFDPSTGFPIY